MSGQDTQTIDYDALAAKHGAVTANQDSSIDYDALAQKHGAVGSEAVPDNRPFGQKVYDRISDNFTTFLKAMEKTGNALFDSSSPEAQEIKQSHLPSSGDEAIKNLKESVPSIDEYRKEPHKLVGDLATAAILHQAMPEVEGSSVKPLASTPESAINAEHLGRIGRFVDLAKRKMSAFGISVQDLENAWNGQPEPVKVPSTKSSTPKPFQGFEGAGTYGTPVDQWGTRIPDPTKGIESKIAEDVKGQAAMQRTKGLVEDSKKADAMNKFSRAESSIAEDVKNQYKGQVIKQRLRAWSQLDPKAVHKAVNDLGSNAAIDDIQKRANQIMDQGIQ